MRESLDARVSFLRRVDAVRRSSTKAALHRTGGSILSFSFTFPSSVVSPQFFLLFNFVSLRRIRRSTVKCCLLVLS